MTIAEQVRAFANTQAVAPHNAIMSAFTREQQALASRAKPALRIANGERLPDAELLSPTGQSTTLQAELAGRRAVLVLYRGVWCPYCNIALNAYQTELLDELNERGVALVAVSPQKPDGSLSMQEKNDLSFSVLSDPGNQLAHSLGILTGPSEEARSAQLQLGLDLKTANADGTTTLPMPTVIVVDADLTVRWVDVHPDYTTRTEPGEILAALDSVQV
jgi:peroxiredoxin